MSSRTVFTLHVPTTEGYRALNVQGLRFNAQEVVAKLNTNLGAHQPRVPGAAS